MAIIDAVESGRVKSEVAKSFDEDNIDSEGPHPIVSFKKHKRLFRHFAHS